MKTGSTPDTQKSFKGGPRQLPSSSADRLVPFPGRVNLRLEVVAYELSRARSFDEDFLHMTPQRSQIFRAFARGESITRIAESCDISYAQAWSQIRRAAEELERKNPSALDAVRWHNYLMLMRIADQAFAAFDRSAEEA
jgi:DNA-binding NarL/FixJ family response regulator